MSDYLIHYGVKGMKWGVQKAREQGRDLNRKQSALRRAKLSRNVSLLRGDSGAEVGFKQDKLNSAKNEYKQAKEEFKQNAPNRVKIERGAKRAAVALATIGALHVVDKKYFGGVGTASAKIAAQSAIKVVGMTAMTAYSAARGHYDISWKV